MKGLSCSSILVWLGHLTPTPAKQQSKTMGGEAAFPFLYSRGRGSTTFGPLATDPNQKLSLFCVQDVEKRSQPFLHAVQCISASPSLGQKPLNWGTCEFMLLRATWAPDIERAKKTPHSGLCLLLDRSHRSAALMEIESQRMVQVEDDGRILGTLGSIYL